MNSTAQLALDPKLPTGPPLKTALKIVSRSTDTRASNEARAWLVVADVTPTGYRVGLFMAKHARYAKPSDIRRNVVPGEIFCYWPQAKIAAGLGCSERQVRRGVRSLREAGALEVRRRVRPCEASYVWVQPVRSDGAGVRSESACVRSGVLSGVLSGVRSHTEPRTEPQKNHEGSSRARVVCPDCGNSWPNKAEYGTECYKCNKKPKVSTWTPADDKPKADVPACTCGTAYHNSYGRLCVDCEGEPSLAQRAAVQAAQDAASTPPRAETETRQPPETRGQRPDSTVAQDDGSPPDGGEGEDEPPPKGGEPGPNELRWYTDLAKWTVGKWTQTQQRSDRRRLTRTARKELADLTKGEQAND